jgi:hypothetical protein
LSRIDELQKEATEEHASHDCWGSYEANFVLDTDKFAQLIIRECAKVAEQTLGTKWVTIELEKHFQVLLR